MFSILYIAVFILIFYFLLIRPQQKNRKKRQELLGSLNVNDRVYTAGGIMGTITMVKEDSVWMKH